MTLTIVPAALMELQEAVDYYSSKASPSLGKALLDEFERAVKIVEVTPQLGAFFRANRRRYFLHKFPYSIIYQVSRNDVVVLALAHHRRRPGYWRDRK